MRQGCGHTRPWITESRKVVTGSYRCLLDVDSRLSAKLSNTTLTGNSQIVWRRCHQLWKFDFLAVSKAFPKWPYRCMKLPPTQHARKTKASLAGRYASGRCDCTASVGEHFRLLRLRIADCLSSRSACGVTLIGTRLICFGEGEICKLTQACSSAAGSITCADSICPPGYVSSPVG